jgi:hypothetical protein
MMAVKNIAGQTRLKKKPPQAIGHLPQIQAEV